jgi:hypothetical protein
MTSVQTQRLECGIAWHGARQELAVISHRLDDLEEQVAAMLLVRALTPCASSYADKPAEPAIEPAKPDPDEGIEERAKKAGQQWTYGQPPDERKHYQMLADFARQEAKRAAIEGEIRGIEIMFALVQGLPTMSKVTLEKRKRIEKLQAELRSQLNA